MRRLTCTAVLLATTAVAAAALTDQAARPAPVRLTVDQLKALKSTTNDPSGDSFIGSYEELSRLIDAIVADASLVSPMYLFLASKTALMLNRVEDAAFLFYGAQLRGAFDFERYDIASRADGNNAATYLGFLRQTIGMTVNPAIMRDPPGFAAVIARLERWNVVPSANAYYPDFAEAKGFRLPAERWADAAARLKDSFMTEFARRQVKLLNDPEYFAAFRIVQSMNLGDAADTPENRARYRQALDTIEKAEARVFPPTPAGETTVQRMAPPGDPTPPSPPSGPLPRRVGPGVPDPKLLRRVEPKFPAGAAGAVILEVVVGVDGRVTDVTILRNDPRLDDAAVAAVRQWQYEIPRADGRPAAVIVTVSLTARRQPL